jgi:hypothetical protein
MDLALVDGMLDDWHQAASVADGERYFAHFTPQAVFMGTDASERWDVTAFRAYAEPYFSEGNGWTYISVERYISFDASGQVGWFDERLSNEKYGEVRGSGVVVKRADVWKLAYYNMSFPLPNELTVQIVEQIRALDASSGD